MLPQYLVPADPQRTRYGSLMRENQHPTRRFGTYRSGLSRKAQLVIESKARKLPPANTRPIVQVADANLPKMTDALTRAMEIVRNGINVDELSRMISAGATGDWMRTLDERIGAVLEGQGVGPKEDSFWDTVLATFQQGAQRTVEELGNQRYEDFVKAKKPASPPIGVTIRFDMTDPNVVAAVQQYKFNLIREVSQSTIDGVQQVLLNAVQQGGHPFEQARIIRQSIGLTQKQAKAVDNFRRYLESGDYRSALSRDLRDHRFDSTIQSAIDRKLAIPQAKIDQMVGRYQERYLKYRSEMIARTETMRAASAGQQETWRAAINQGLLPQNVKRFWLVLADDKLCDICAAVPDNNADGVGLDEPFQTGFGAVDYPPAHPSCRCDVVLGRGTATVAPKPPSIPAPTAPSVPKPVPEAAPKPSAPQAFKPKVGLNDLVNLKGVPKNIKIVDGLKWADVSEAETKAFTEYTDGAAQKINEAARGLAKKPPKDIQQYAKDIANVLDRSEAQQDFYSFRGLNGAQFNDLKVGDTISDKGFMSTSTDPRVARKFAHGNDSMLAVRVSKGDNVMAVSKFQSWFNENEVLIQQNSTLKIVNVVEVKGDPLRGIKRIYEVVIEQGGGKSLDIDKRLPARPSEPPEGISQADWIAQVQRFVIQPQDVTIHRV